MKTRNGFVSNSSSSCYIIREDIGSIARNMLDIVILDFSEWDNESPSQRRRDQELYNTWRQNLETSLENGIIANNAVGVTFPSCNYDTYIVMVDGVCYITTANNHTWDINAPNSEYNDNENELIHDMFEGRFVFNLRNGLIHTMREYDFGDEKKLEGLICAKCGRDIWAYVVDQDGNMICGTCFETKLGVCQEFLDKREEEERYQKALTEKDPFPSPINDIEIHE